MGIGRMCFMPRKTRCGIRWWSRRDRKSSFETRHFNVQQKCVGLRVTADAITFGCVCTRAGDLDFEKILRRGGRLLDVGTGTGVLALIVAQQLDPKLTTHRVNSDIKHSQVLAIDPDPLAIHQARLNFRAAKLKKKWPSSLLQARHVSLQQLTNPRIHPVNPGDSKEKGLRGFSGSLTGDLTGQRDSTGIPGDSTGYPGDSSGNSGDSKEEGLEGISESLEGVFDWICCNPPFHGRPGPGANPSVSKARERARFAEFLPIEDLMERASRLLKPGGVIWILQAYQNEAKSIRVAKERKLIPCYICRVSYRPGSSPKRTILKFRKKNGETIDEDCEEDTLTTLGTKEEGGPRFSEEFKCLTRHVYLDQMLNQRYKPSCHMRKQ